MTNSCHSVRALSPATGAHLLNVINSLICYLQECRVSPTSHWMYSQVVNEVPSIQSFSTLKPGLTQCWAPTFKDFMWVLKKCGFKEDDVRVVTVTKLGMIRLSPVFSLDPSNHFCNRLTFVWLTILCDERLQAAIGTRLFFDAG